MRGRARTHVLSRRVVRLLLARVPPSRILCLTYTKAAAANMATRIFDILAKWTLLEDNALDIAVQEAAGAPLTPSDRDFARKLFARTLETPGGLKIQTIHAFCEKILHLFPFEANVPVGFSVMDDIERATLLSRAREEALDRAFSEDGELLESLKMVARHASGKAFDDLIEELLRHRVFSGGEARAASYERTLRVRLGLEKDESLAMIEARIISEGIKYENWRELAKRLRQGSANDGKLAEQLMKAVDRAPENSCIEEYLLVFFTQKGTPRGGSGAMITEKLRKSDPELAQLLEREHERLLVLIERRKVARSFVLSQALAVIGEAVVSNYERMKNHRGLFDFDDLIERTRALLRRSSPSWVLYKLDQQIDHILLDEAQDTSAPQWEILKIIANEFAESTRPRTFFAVGDEKQSIFSFQGAAPDKFEAMRRGFETRFGQAQLPFEHVRLTLSFRSSPAILASVDAIFEFGHNKQGLSVDPQEPAPAHSAWKRAAPGLVEIWEALGPVTTKIAEDWRLPLDFVVEEAPSVRLARKVARKIVLLLNPDEGEWVQGKHGPRAVTAGDIMILVRKRDNFFEAMIRALKELRVPVAGADRLDLMNHIAVMDLCALGRAALLREDDLTLATVLKSPLIGLDDEDLVALAPRRAGSLFDALKRSRASAHQAAAQCIDEWSREARRLAPFDFYSRILGAGRGREKLVARLGAEANDAMDEFLRLALEFEHNEPGLLTRFLVRVEKLNISVRRDMESGGDAVRVMTVHAAKGLESKIVFLPDCCGGPTGRHDPKIFTLMENEDADDASFAWSPKADADPACVARARAKLRESAHNEYRRLLYVALTRAEERLYISGFFGDREPPDGCWYRMIRGALEGNFVTLPDPDDTEKHILRSPNAPARIMLTHHAAPNEIARIPGWARTAARPEASPTPVFRPSLALVEVNNASMKQPSDELLVGRLTHALLQNLPRHAPDQRRALGLRFLELHGMRLEASHREALVGAVLKIIGAPSLAPLFGDGSAPEVDIIGRIDTLNGPRDIVGRIDRVAELPTKVLLADFKTGDPRVMPSASQLVQLALYRAAALPLYPGKVLRCMLVFTQDASVFEPSEAALQGALRLIGAKEC